jgi:quinol monooxygenase YgiN
VDSVLMIQEVTAYRAWRDVYDEAIEMRRRAGERSYRLLRYESDDNHIVHFSQWTSLEDARRFFESTELEAMREKAGVAPPEFIYLRQMEDGALG